MFPADLTDFLADVADFLFISIQNLRYLRPNLLNLLKIMSLCVSLNNFDKINFIMESQNFKNHSRFVPLFHGVLFFILFIILVLASINLFSGGISVLSVMFFLMAFASLLGAWFIRAFPIKAQDRAIRAEENLRYFSLTGRLLDKNLTMPQIIALRFADDDEFEALADEALAKKMSNKEIKQAIQNWRADHHRV